MFHMRGSLCYSCDDSSRTVKKTVGDAPKEPKKPPSAYFIFVAEKRSTLSGNIDFKQLSLMWNELSVEEKKVYDNKALELKVEYEKEFAIFKESLNKDRMGL